MAFITFSNDRARQLKFGFNSMNFLQSAHGVTDIVDFLKSFEGNNFANLSVLIESCLASDNDGLTSKKINDMLDDYVEKNGLDKLMSLVKQTIEEAALFKEAIKKKQIQTPTKKIK